MSIISSYGDKVTTNETGDKVIILDDGAEVIINDVGVITEITTIGKIVNEKPIKGAVNPWECHTFENQILFTETFEPTQSLLEEKWYLSGDVPIGLTISDTGLINGRIETFDKQTSVKDRYPLEDIKLDGSNWLHTGGMKGSTHTFTFNVGRWIRYEEEAGTEAMPSDTVTTDSVPTGPIVKEEETESVISIMVIKNNDITNLLFVVNYLKAGHEMKIGNDTYTYDLVNDFLSRHPGPFGCPKQ